MPATPTVGSPVWMALVGTIGAIVGGVLHAASRAARETAGNFWISRAQTGMTPWLGIAALSAFLMVVAYVALPFYTVTGGPAESWTGWMAIPHTAGLVLLAAAIVVTLAVATARSRAPMGPTGLGATIAVLGLVATVRTAYRMVVAPFYSGPAEGLFEAGAQINLAAWMALLFGVVTIVAGIAHAAGNREFEAQHHPAEPGRATA